MDSLSLLVQRASHSWGLLISIVAGAGLLLFLLYRWLLPKPIPGIPYNAEATKSLLGDIPSMVEYGKQTQEVFSWMAKQNIKLNSPIVQVFTRPFSRPSVVISDFREAQDILIRRFKEFDRSKYISEISGGIMPHSHFRFPTGDRFRRQRKWMQGAMGVEFLHNVAAPHVYNAALDLLRLWETKASLAAGHPFAAADDLHRTTMDAVWNILFGVQAANSVLKAQLRLYEDVKRVELPDDRDAVVSLPAVPYPELTESFLRIIDSVETTIKSPVPVLAHWLLRQTPAMKRAWKHKDQYIEGELKKALERAQGRSAKDRDINCAVDDFVRRELLLAEKEKRAPEVLSPSMSDEVLGFVVGSQDTTATTMSWGIKNLADNPDVQKRLRAELHAHHSKAVEEKRLPTPQEITSTPIHYRDAVIEEILRCSSTESSAIRTALTDVTILGHFIPKDTEIFLMGNGASFYSPEFEISDSLRTQSCLESKDKVGAWSHADMAKFNPDRWLPKGVFDQAAGPLLTFGLGERACYGRKMAYVQLKILVTLVVWSFELHKCPEKLSGYAASDKVTHVPQQCYARLSKIT
ncbi:cytochrome P450 [Hypoxylon sp. FL0543]|nr:cytochrome P450 [Hypoxylon sp. FL0543]